MISKSLAMIEAKIYPILGLSFLSLLFASASEALPSHNLLAFQAQCLERGDTARHQNVSNPLSRDEVACDSELKWRALARREAIAKFTDGITLCNWNVYGLPVKKSGTRQKNIADYVAYGCDIFSGQEHWSVFDRSGFRGRSRNTFSDWTFKYFSHPLPLHPGSGIMIGSVWPIVKTKYSPWPGGLFKNAGYKGVGYAQIRTPQGLLDLYNLHLAAGRSFDLKEKQVEHLIEFVQKTHDPSLPLVINGDFNFNRRWRLPSRKVNALTWLNEKLEVRPVGFQSRIEYTLLNDRVSYLDHRVLADWDDREVYMSEPFIKELADHPGILTRVLLKP